MSSQRCSLFLKSTFYKRPVCIHHKQTRLLNLQEYQSKQILHQYGVKVQRFKVASNEQEIKKIIFPHRSGQFSGGKWSGFQEDISGVKEFVIKAQILAGGRGKGFFKRSGLSGVILIEDRQKAASAATTMLGDFLVTKQTGDSGVLVEKVMIAEAVRLTHEYYLALVFDRSHTEGPILVASPKGGMDIEEIAAKDETAIRKFTLPLDIELDSETAKKIAVLAFDLNTKDGDIIEQCSNEIIKLHKMFLDLDATQIEINPLGVTKQRQVISVDSKINFDENARFRNKLIKELEQMNTSETDPREFEAKKHDLNFIGLTGSIGCLVNGAGLAMATMDIIKLHGGEPANFLDVGGGASSDQVAAALRIINSDKNVRAIFVNIFGGIMRCDTAAQGILDAVRSLNINLPLVVRLAGTRVEEAKALIEASDLQIKPYIDFDAAARESVRLSRA